MYEPNRYQASKFHLTNFKLMSCFILYLYNKIIWGKNRIFFECRWYVYISLFVFICNSIPAILGNAAASHKKKERKSSYVFFLQKKLHHTIG